MGLVFVCWVFFFCDNNVVEKFGLDLMCREDWCLVIGGWIKWVISFFGWGRRVCFFCDEKFVGKCGIGSKFMDYCVFFCCEFELWVWWFVIEVFVVVELVGG